jgi:hypothetical protein
MFRKKKPSLDVGRLIKIMDNPSTEEISAVLYVEESVVKKWSKKPNRVLDPYDADVYANRIGLHPFQIWGWDWVDAA